MSSILSELHPLKTATAAEIIARIEEISAPHQGLAEQVRQILSRGSNGPRPMFLSGYSDKRSVEIALLGILVDEMSYAPSSPQRHEQIQQVEMVCARMNIEYDDVVRCGRRAAELTKLFEAK